MPVPKTDSRRYCFLCFFMRKNCSHCRASFEITANDLVFYDKVSPTFGHKKCPIPPPTLCPDCRRQLRLSFRNERHLYHRKCDLSGKQIISNHSTEAVYPVYAYEEWWSDKWNAVSYGIAFDPSKSFFEQYAELQ